MITKRMAKHYLHTMLVNDKLENGRPSFMICEALLGTVEAWENINECVVLGEGELIMACNAYWNHHSELKKMTGLTYQQTDELISDAKYILDTLKGYDE